MSIYEHKKSRVYWCRFWHNGKEYRRSTGETDRRRAEAAERRIRTEVEDSATVTVESKRSGIKLADLAGLDIERAIAGGTHQEKVIASIKLHWRHVLQIVGDVPPSDVTYQVAQRYIVSRRNEGARAQTIKRELGALYRGLKIAVRNNWLRYMPRDWPRLKADAPDAKKKGKLHPPEIIAAWLNELTPDARDEAEFVALTGLRATEVKRVRATWVEPAPKGSLCPALLRLPASDTKTRKERVVGLPKSALEIIRRRLQQDPNCEFVFSQSEHKKTHYGAARRIGYDKRITLRDLRHTYATLGLHATGDATAVQAALGHADLATTQRYLSSTLQRTAAVGAAIEALIRPATGAPAPEHPTKNSFKKG